MLQFLAGDMQHLKTHRCSVDVARNGINYTVLRKSASQLSFALLFSSIRAFSAKRTISNFRSNSRRGTCNNLQCATVPSTLLGLGSTIQGYVSLLHRSIFCEKKYLKFSLQFPAGDMQLLGGGYLCSHRCQCGDPRHHIQEEQHCLPSK
jgi:hypothetical protein